MRVAHLLTSHTHAHVCSTQMTEVAEKLIPIQKQIRQGSLPRDSPAAGYVESKLALNLKCVVQGGGSRHGWRIWTGGLGTGFNGLEFQDQASLSMTLANGGRPCVSVRGGESWD